MLNLRLTEVKSTIDGPVAVYECEGTGVIFEVAEGTLYGTV